MLIKFLRCKLLLVLSMLFIIPNSLAQQKLSDREIRQLIIRESIVSYPGECPCPYSRMSDGSRCGNTSAYSKAGGYSTVCYDKDVTASMITKFRAKKSGDND